MSRTLFLFVPFLLIGAGCAQTQAPTPGASSGIGVDPAVQSGEKFVTRDTIFELPVGWELVSLEKKEKNNGSIVTMRVSEDPYRVDLVLYLDPFDASGVELRSPLETTPHVTFYNEGCGGCWFSRIMDFSDNTEMPDYIATLTIEGDEPPPPNLDGPWMPKSTASKEQVMEMLKTARPIPR